MRYNPVNNYIVLVQSMLEGMEGMEGLEGMLYLLVLKCSSVEIVLSTKELEGCALYARVVRRRVTCTGARRNLLHHML